MSKQLPGSLSEQVQKRVELYTYKFALKPTRLQAILLNKHCGAVRY
ncbi:MAG: helix-turn-helix domain-containing protein, partial [Patescibacteria group bacterium]